MSDDFSFASSGLPPNLRVASFRGSEGLSRCYWFDVFLTVAADLDIDAMDVMARAARSRSKPPMRCPT